MASGLVTLVRTNSDGEVHSFGVPGENDVNAAYFETRPLELGSPDVDKWVEAVVNELTGTYAGVTLSYIPMNRMTGDSETWIEIGDPTGDEPLFLDEDLTRVMRYVRLRWDDSQLNDWSLSGFAVWGDFEGDEDALL